MKAFIFSIIAAIALTACGGGGSSPLPQTTPTPVHTATPTPAPYYALTLRVTGGTMPRSGLSYTRRAQSVTTQGAGTNTPPPVLMVAPDTANGLGQYAVGQGDASALATVSVAPSPSASPSATWSNNASNSISVTPQSNDQTQATVATTKVNATGTGTMTIDVTIGGVVQAPLQTPIITYPRATVSCPQTDQSSGPIPQEWVQGIVFDTNGDPVATNDPTQADLYVTGPKCYGAYASVESATTLHFPHGGHLYSDTFKSFNEYTATDYQGDETSMTIDAMQAASPVLTTISLKDAFGAIHFIHFDTLGDLDRESGGHKACGHNPVDGSC